MSRRSGGAVSRHPLFLSFRRWISLRETTRFYKNLAFAFFWILHWIGTITSEAKSNPKFKRRTKKMKKILCGLLCLILVLSIAACGSATAAVSEAVPVPETVAAPAATEAAQTVTAPKYVLQERFSCCFCCLPEGQVCGRFCPLWTRCCYCGRY